MAAPIMPKTYDSIESIYTLGHAEYILDISTKEKVCLHHHRQRHLLEHLPYHLLAVVSTKKNGKTVYTPYDAADFEIYKRKVSAYNQDKQLCDPFTKGIIQDIQYIASKCFSVKLNQESQEFEDHQWLEPKPQNLKVLLSHFPANIPMSTEKSYPLTTLITMGSALCENLAKGPRAEIQFRIGKEFLNKGLKEKKQFLVDEAIHWLYAAARSELSRKSEDLLEKIFFKVIKIQINQMPPSPELLPKSSPEAIPLSLKQSSEQKDTLKPEGKPAKSREYKESKEHKIPIEHKESVEVKASHEKIAAHALSKTK